MRPELKADVGSGGMCGLGGEQVLPSEVSPAVSHGIEDEEGEAVRGGLVQDKTESESID